MSTTKDHLAEALGMPPFVGDDLRYSTKETLYNLATQRDDVVSLEPDRYIGNGICGICGEEATNSIVLTQATKPIDGWVTILACNTYYRCDQHIPSTLL